MNDDAAPPRRTRAVRPRAAGAAPANDDQATDRDLGRRRGGAARRQPPVRRLGTRRDRGALSGPRPVGRVRARGHLPLRAACPARRGDDVARPRAARRRPSSRRAPRRPSGSRCRLTAYADGTLDVAVERVEGPDVVLSELRLFSSRPPAPAITVVGDSRGGLIGIGRGAGLVGGGRRARARDAATPARSTSSTDATGLFRVPLDEGLPLGRHGRVTIATGDGPTAAELVVDTRHVSRGLRELPPASERLDLGGRLELPRRAVRRPRGTRPTGRRRASPAT